MKNKGYYVSAALAALMLMSALNGCATVEEGPRSFEEAFAAMVGPVGFNDEGVTNTRDGQYDRAIHNFDRAIRLNPKYAAAYYNRGTAYMRNGDPDRAIDDFGYAISLDPKLDVVFISRGLIYFNRGEYDRAISDFDRAIQLKPTSAESYYLRGLALTNKGDSERAIEDFDRAIENFKIVTEMDVGRDKADCERIAYDRAAKLPPKEVERTPTLVINSAGLTIADGTMTDPSGVSGILRPGQRLFAACMRSKGH